MTGKSPIVLLAFLSFLSTEVVGRQSELDVQDSLVFYQFVQDQNEIPGLTYRLVLSGDYVPDLLESDSIWSLQGSPKQVMSPAWTLYSEADSVIQKLERLGIFYNRQFEIFGKKASLTAAQEYVANLLRNSDIQLKKKRPVYRDDLINLAAGYPYSPFYDTNFFLGKLGLSQITDFRLIIVILLILLFFGSSSGILIFMLVFKARRNRTEFLIKEYQKMISDPVAHLILEKEVDQINDLTDQELNEMFPPKFWKKELFRKVTGERIVGLTKQMKGDFKTRLKALFRRINLHSETIANLNSKQWDKVASALVYVNEMDIMEALPRVQELLNSKNFHIRSNAVMTMLNLSESTDLTFLRDQKYPLSEWQQMNYLRLIRNLYPNKPVNIRALFESKNESVRIFGHRIVRFMGFVEHVDEFESVAVDLTDQEKIEALKGLEMLFGHTQADFVNKCLNDQNPKIRKAAIQTGGAIGDAKTTEILLSQIGEEKDFGTKMALMRSLRKLDEIAYNSLIERSENKTLNLIHLHLSDPLLQNV